MSVFELKLKAQPTADRFLYWYQELKETKQVMYGTFLTHAEAVTTFGGKYAYGLVYPIMSTRKAEVGERTDTRF